jgi:hypothetical protein
VGDRRSRLSHPLYLGISEAGSGCGEEVDEVCVLEKSRTGKRYSG